MLIEVLLGEKKFLVRCEVDNKMLNDFVSLLLICTFEFETINNFRESTDQNDSQSQTQSQHIRFFLS
jgi:hypothetical protein